MNATMMIANSVQLPVEPPERIKLLPLGEVTRKDDGKFTVNADGVQSMIDTMAENGLDIPIDYEHHTLGDKYAAPDGTAPAAGWIKAIELVNDEGETDGVYADVEWTERGAGFVRNKEYRYLSPVVVVRKLDGHAVKIHSVALTNTPMIKGMVPIVNKDIVMPNNDIFDDWQWKLNLPVSATETEIMDELKKILGQMAQLVGAKEGTEADQIVTALKEKLEGNDALQVSVCKALKIDAASDGEAIVAAIETLANKAPANPADSVPKDEHEKVLAINKEQGERLKTIEEEMLTNKCDAFIERGMKEGKIVEGSKAQWRDSFLANAEKAEGYLKDAPVIAAPDGRQIDTSRKATPTKAGGDPIVANAERFDDTRMGDHKRIKEYQLANKCTYEEAMVACGAG